MDDNFQKQESQKGSFLEQTRIAREERANEEKKKQTIREMNAEKEFEATVLNQFSDAVPSVEETYELKPALEIYKKAEPFLLIWKKNRDQQLFERFCRYIVISLKSQDKNLSYAGIYLMEEYKEPWISHIKKTIKICYQNLKELKPESPSDMKTILVYLHTLVAFTGTKTWEVLKCSQVNSIQSAKDQICQKIVNTLDVEEFYAALQSLLLKGLRRSKIALKHVPLSAIMALSLLPLEPSNFSNEKLSLFIKHILSVPALVSHIEELSSERLALFAKNEILYKILLHLHEEKNVTETFNALEGNYTLCLLGNLVQLCHIERETTLTEKNLILVITVLSKLLLSCKKYVVARQSNLTHWHPILGWFSQNIDPGLQETLHRVKAQLKLLWSGPMIMIFLGETLKKIVKTLEEPSTSQTSPPNTLSDIFKFVKRKLENKGNKYNSTKCKIIINSKENILIAYSIALYHIALVTLTQVRLDILTGLCYQGEILYYYWQYLRLYGSDFGVVLFSFDLQVNKRCFDHNYPAMLSLFCDCMTHYVTLLDDYEMYDKPKMFQLSDFIVMSELMNNLLYNCFGNSYFDISNLNTDPVFQSLHTLLSVLYRRDCRRRYAPADHWLIKDIRISRFVNDLEKGGKISHVMLQKMPYIIPHSERVQLFRKFVAREKATYGHTESACASPRSTDITVRRNNIVEDGYNQLASLSPQALKGVIRVRFKNQQGLDEAGIDQSGVFKEFLEEVIKRVFDPSLNLFRVTSEERLYPSPTSHMQDNHLKLFEFVGRMLGKAVYEGITVDVPFASFFLSQLLGQPQLMFYSSIDELPSLDPELYRSFTFIKHGGGDVKDLGLTFSINEDCMGKIVTHELVPGGKLIEVTEDNKINYIHLVAHFRMHTQIKDQAAAFIQGFRSIINPEWLNLFSTPELQRLISGDDVPLDLKDLRKHTQYYGGFHDSHRVVGWLWDVLEKDFNTEEKGLFLKFVTSCSKPPLLGFAHLQPPFSVRCIEEGDDEDTGDTVASVIRGFFTIRKKDSQNRLPTSSTCFNILKLPNYQKRDTLRDKLKYAVKSNTGFELS
ncbi:UNVERIFIED_CONTAM: hypothetical protein PYX00_005501 [Menopon gallinae]|uniref:Ubiquitin-protein ligase E3B n=1 Tax=Menopon gallinae TaxID=328185 RepID=A0AAW2HRZ8_9NEOP